MSQDLEKIQAELAARVFIPPEGSGYQPQMGDQILAMDIQYDQNQAYVAGAIQSWGSDQIQAWAGACQVGADYQSGFFCFREGPPLYDFLKALATQKQIKPQLIIVDGHGIAHPRRFGVASWLGLATQTPTLGCAKRTLLPYATEPALSKGSTTDVWLDEEKVGFVLRSRTGVKPIFVSPGHLVSLATAQQVILGLKGTYRIPELLRQADQMARAYQKGEAMAKEQSLGKISPSPRPFLIS